MKQPTKFLRTVVAIAFEIASRLSVAIALLLLFLLLFTIVRDASPWISLEFFTNVDSRFSWRAGIRAALAGTVLLMTLTLLFSFPIGVMSAIYLEEYAKDNWFTRFIELNISNLAAIPSIIYGLLGLQIFVRYMLLGRSLLAGALTMSLLVLPTIVVVSREAIRAVPQSLRDASYGLGATRWQTVYYHVLPYALPGIMTGNILAASRAIGETAPLITIGALTFVPFLPRHLLDRFTVLPIQIFNWTSKAQTEFHGLAAAAIVVLLCVVLLMNSVAIILRQRLKKHF